MKSAFVPAIKPLLDQLVSADGRFFLSDKFYDHVLHLVRAIIIERRWTSFRPIRI